MPNANDVDMPIPTCFAPQNRVTLFLGDCMALLSSLPSESVQLVVTSPPYNIGKAYEERLNIEVYKAQQQAVIDECIRVLKPTGSICWQVGSYVSRGEIVPLDILLYDCFKVRGLTLRNRIIWHYGHGLHCTKRFSGRYEVIMWFTKSDQYLFNLDPVRVPQKYPGKRDFRGPKKGHLSGNPKGKNPSDVWDIPNVKANHVEKTAHPCQFPIALVQRLLLSMSHLIPSYYELAVARVKQALRGDLPRRADKPVYNPKKYNITTNPWK